MTTAEAAAKWAEAKEARDKARDAWEAAQKAFQEAEGAERSAWVALEELAGRTPPAGPPAPKLPSMEELRRLYPSLPVRVGAQEYAFDDGFKR